MPSYLSPGVYIEEVDAGPQPIEGVSTSTVGAVGVTLFGPTSGPPVLVTSFAEFERTFGGFMAPPASGLFNTWDGDANEGGHWWQFALSVKGFFDNLGQRMYVKRVFADKALASSGSLGQGLVARVTLDATANATEVQLDSLIDVMVGSSLSFQQGDNSKLMGTATVTAYDPAHNTVLIKLAAPLTGPLSVTRGDFAVIQAPAANTTLIFNAAARGAWGNDLSVRVRPVTTNFRILFDPNLGDLAATGTLQIVANVNDTKITVTPVAGTFTKLHRITINGDEYDVASVAGNVLTLGVVFDKIRTLYQPGAIVRQLRSATNLADTINVWGAAQLYTNAIVELDNGTLKESFTVLDVTGTTVKLSGKVKQGYWEGETLRLVEAEVGVRYAPNGVITTTETFTALRLFNDGSNSYIETAINQRSNLVTVILGGSFVANDYTKFPVSLGPLWTPLGKGDDMNGLLSVDDFTGVNGTPNDPRGIDALELQDNVSIIVAPGMWSQTVQNALITQCELLRDRFAILDPQFGLDVSGKHSITAARQGIDTKYAALYYPWLVVRDPLAQSNVLLAPSAHLAGIYARVDDSRGVHKAPANETILGINGLERIVTKREQDVLNPYPTNIDVLRAFPDRGFRVWGARVLTSDPQWKYINVRRLFIFLEVSLNVGTQWVVFEPNDEPLWARVRQSVANFLTTVWRSGALQGLTTDEAFFVKVDRTTMTQDDIDNGRLIILVGVAPVKPAEFVIFRIQQKTLDLSPTP